MASGASERAKARAEGLVGTTVDSRYRIDRILAKGAMGTVYLARHLKLKKRVAMKTLHPDVEDHPELVMRFEREALAGAQVSHPNVACATDFGDLDDGTRYLVMEYVRGTNLRTAIDRDAPISPERAVRIARQIAVALGHIHDKGIVHRDLKPRNVMLSDEDFVKVVDFGLAKLDGQRISGLPDDEIDELDEDSRLTSRGVIFGTIEYLAPEAAFGMELVDSRADLYALGVILYEMLCGKHPFEAKTDAELFAKQRHAPAPPLASRTPGLVVPPEIEKVVQKLLSKDFDERYQTAAEAIAALDHAMPSASTPPPEPADPPPSSAVPSLPPPSESSQPPTSAPEAEKSDTQRKESKRAESADRARSSNTVLVLVVLGLGAAGLYAYLSRGTDEPRPAPTASAAQTSPLPSASSSSPPRSSATAPSPDASASAAPSESAAPSTSAAPVESAIAPEPTIDLPTFRRRLSDDIKGDKWDDLSEATLAFLAGSPEAACNPDTSKPLSSALGALSKHTSSRGDEAWRKVALAKCGADMLYGFVETGGKAPFAERATEMLRDDDVSKAASPALRIAFSLHDAPCKGKLLLVDRAVEEGDERSLTALDIQVRGCTKNTKVIDVAMTRLRARLDAEKPRKKK